MSKYLQDTPAIISICAKCSDSFSANLLNAKRAVIGEYVGYVPAFFPDEHYGDYVMLDISISDGRIMNWRPPTPDELAHMFKLPEKRASWSLEQRKLAAANHAPAAELKDRPVYKWLEAQPCLPNSIDNLLEVYYAGAPLAGQFDADELDIYERCLIAAGATPETESFGALDPHSAKHRTAETLWDIDETKEFVEVYDDEEPGFLHLYLSDGEKRWPVRTIDTADPAHVLRVISAWREKRQVVDRRNNQDQPL